MSDTALQATIEKAFTDRSLLKSDEVKKCVEEAIARLDGGTLRVATENAPGSWTTHAWVKQAILLYFAISPMEKLELPPFEFFDKIPLKKNLDRAGVRVVPPGTVRYGAFVESGAIVMPGYVNIGAYVGSGTMVDTWATVGSCAQIGKDCHLSGEGGTAGGLGRPARRRGSARAGCFLGPRAWVVKGLLLGGGWWAGPAWCSRRRRRSSTSRAASPSSTEGGSPPAASSSPGCDRASSPQASTWCRARSSSGSARKARTSRRASTRRCATSTSRFDS